MEHQGEGEGEEAYISKGFVGKILWRVTKLTAPLLQPFGPRSSTSPADISEEDIKFLERKLDRIKATLKDYTRLDTSLESVKLWLSELRDLESCIEDIIEELEFESMWKPNVSQFRCSKITGKRKRDEISFLFSSCPRNSLHLKIVKIRNLYNEIASDRQALRLRKDDGMMLTHCCPRPESTSLPIEDIADLHGRKNEVKHLISILLSEASHQHDIPVIAIAGMAGIGKTTLTQHVFNHEEVHSHFDERIWVCMSEGPNVERITRKIRDSLMKECCASSELSLDLLQRDVMSQLRGKRFLLVLDDAWNREFWRSHWEIIQSPLKVGASASKVIVTTRDIRITNIMGALHLHHLSCLSDADCWLICQKYAYNSQQQACPELIQVGKEITKKCKGLPLAAKVFGYLLRTEFNEESWRQLLQSDLFCLDEFKNAVLPVLSYDNLPTHLKRCFPYCSLFPKNYTFEKDLLVRLWMAQGFVEPKEGSKLEDTGNKYFNELVERTLLQYDSGEKRFVMHDLYQELAQSVAGHNCLKTEDHRLCEVHKKTRHLSLVPYDLHENKSIEFKITGSQDLRSLLLIKRHERIETPFHIEISSASFEFLQCLRALDLSNTNIDQLPVSIGNLIHLRYLGLENTKIKRLPESICCMFKLQTLNLRQCYDLEDLPQGIRLLPNLHVESPLQCHSKISMSIAAQTVSVREICMDSVGCASQGTR